jgi:hypothetical protein
MKKLLLGICLLLTILITNIYSGTSAGLGNSFQEAYENAMAFKTSQWKIYNIKYIYVDSTKYRPYRCYIYWTD